MFKLFKNLTARDWLFAVISIVLIAVQVQLDLKMPDYMSEITTLVETEGSDMADILYNGGFMLLCAAGSLVAAIITGYFMATIAADFSQHTRSKLFRKVEDLSMPEVHNFSVNSLITRTTNDITQVQMFIAMGLQMLIKAPLTAVLAVGKILGKSWEWSAATAVAVVILLATVIALMVLVIPRFKIVQKTIDKLNGVTRENLTGIRVVHAFNAEQHQEHKFERVNDQLTGLQLFNQRALATLSPMMYLVMYYLTLSIYLIGAYLIDGSAYADRVGLFGDMVVFSSYAMQVIMSFLMLAMIFMILPRANVSAKRIAEVLDTPITIQDGIAIAGDADERGSVEFRHVSFKYPGADEYLLRDISFTAKQGETVAFIGSTGSGKSTLINLIPRFYDVTDGEVLVDGRDVREYKLSALYDKLGYVSQRAVIFDDSIEKNVLFGNQSKKTQKSSHGTKSSRSAKSSRSTKSSQAIVRKALRVAQATEFVNKLPRGTKAHVSQGGTNISGGQKQRLSIARAIARDPEIYIFDDTFSALDYKTDAALRRALKTEVKDATCLIVAQRIGTIMNADRIVVLDQGRSVGIGTHQELLKTCPVYQQIARSQLSEEELNRA